MSLFEPLKKLNELDLADLGDLDLENIGAWPLVVRIIACILTLVVVLLLGYQVHLSGLKANYNKAVAKEGELKEQYRIKAFQAANLEAYQNQMIEMEASFGALIRQLPSDTEVPGLLEDITFTGRGAGLQFESIQLQPEISTEFYIELPISITVKGSYHDLGAFVSGVSSLPRIVTLHDFSISPAGNRKALRMDILARTYRYNNKEL
ncbi:MAG: type 4a pilus biogenesis protein PilO [Endozoicomonas sp.]